MDQKAILYGSPFVSQKGSSQIKNGSKIGCGDLALYQCGVKRVSLKIPVDQNELSKRNGQLIEWHSTDITTYKYFR